MKANAFEEFILTIMWEINEFRNVDSVRKEMTECLLRYLLVFRIKTVKFNIDGLANHSSMAPSHFLQPYDTTKTPFNVHAMFKYCGVVPKQINPDEYMSLIESTLRMMMSYQLVVAFPGILWNDEGSFKIRKYPILSRFLKYDRDDGAFATTFSVEFSDHFWEDFRNNT